MRRPSSPLSRRDVIKTFGLASLLMHPVMRSMAQAAPTPFKSAPRYVMFFKGGSFYPSRTNPQSLNNLAGTPIAPLEPHAKDLILFKNMNIHGGSPKSDGYKEEHAAGVIGCTTGNSYKYSKNDAYFAYTDNESIDIRIANHYKGRADLADIPLSSLHIGAGAHSDADQVGVGNRYISFRNRQPGDSRYGNAIEPVQDAGQVYEKLMAAAASQCSGHSRQPLSDMDKLVARTTNPKQLLADAVYADFKEYGGNADTRTRREVKVSFEALRQTECNVRRQARPAGDGANKKNLDQLSPIHDQMISMIKLAFEMDLTRVVAFTLSGGSSGQNWPSQGIHEAHHTLEHNGKIDSLVKIDSYYAEKFGKLLTTLKSIDDGSGKSALYNSSVMLGMECWSNSSSGHYLTDIPFVFAGQGGGRFETHRIIDAHGRNNNDLHVSCLNAAGIKTNTFGLTNLCQGPII